MAVTENERPLYAYRGFNAEHESRPDHQPSRPSWSCGTCGEEWPCPTARERLMRELSGTRLAMLMWAHMEAFAFDAGPGPLRDWFERFIGWTWQRPNLP